MQSGEAETSKGVEHPVGTFRIEHQADCDGGDKHNPAAAEFLQEGAVSASTGASFVAWFDELCYTENNPTNQEEAAKNFKVFLGFVVEDDGDWCPLLFCGIQNYAASLLG